MPQPDQTPLAVLTDRPEMRFAPQGTAALSLFLIEAGADLPAALTPAQAAFARAQGFTGAAGQLCLLPGEAGVAGALFGYGTAPARARKRFLLAQAAAGLPEGAWQIVGDLRGAEAEEAALGWLLEGYRYARYAPAKAPCARLVAPAGVDRAARGDRGGRGADPRSDQHAAQ